MERILFLKIQYFILFFRVVLAPFFNFLLFPLIPFTRARLAFEAKNLTDPYSKSFKMSAKVAPFLFEISSEGELDQVRPLIDFFISRNENVEIIFASPSVEKKVMALAQESQGRVAIFRLPLLSFFPFIKGRDIFQFATAKNIIFCRYDFYPELFALTHLRGGKAILVNATLKGKKRGGLYRQLLYKYFDAIVAGTKRDGERIVKELGGKVVASFDFRTIAIFKRLNNRGEHFKKSEAISLLINDLERFPYRKRVVLGSAWPIEMDAFRNDEFKKGIIKGEWRVLIFPHKLSSDYLDSIMSSIPYDLPHFLINKESKKNEIENILSNNGVIVVGLSGYLCEFYAHVGHAFVGGGHGRSIHSILEPFLAGAVVYCGPKTFRSTEFDLIREFSSEHLFVIDQLEELYPFLLKGETLPLLTSKIEQISTSAKEKSLKIQEELLS